MNYANLRCRIMPSYSRSSQSQGIKLIKFVLDKSKLERVTFFIVFPVNSENLPLL